MQTEYDFFRESSTVIYSIVRRLVTNVYLTQSDIADVRMTIYEQDSPLSNDGVPVPYFDEVVLDKTKVVYDTLQNGQLENKYGIYPIQFNFAHVIAPCIVTSEGVESKIYPFPNIGKCYKVLYSFKSANPDIPDFSIQVIGYAV